LKGGQYGQNFVEHFEDDAPDFTMWNEEGVQAYAELIEEYPQFSGIMGEKENREALKELFKEKGLDSWILKEVPLCQEAKQALEQEKALEELETLTMDVDDWFPPAG
jgi:hypothetical protein